jgi:hypothetical protein
MNNEELDEKTKEVYKKIIEYKDKLKKCINIIKISQESNVDFEIWILKALQKSSLLNY